MKLFSRKLPIVVFALVAIWQMQPAALAQVPPHKPGEICITSRLWCWARSPGQPGAACTCPSPYGLLSGTLG